MILTSVSNANEVIRDVTLKRSNYDGKTSKASTFVKTLMADLNQLWLLLDEKIKI